MKRTKLTLRQLRGRPLTERELSDLVSDVPYRNHVSRGLVTWRYLPGRKITAKHALSVSSMTLSGYSDVSLCGQWPGGSRYWMGTGNQNEYDKLAELRECKTCLRFITPGIDDGTGSPKKEDSKVD